MSTGPTMEHHLEVLPAMLNLLLVQTGKVLRDTDLHNSQNSGLARRRIGGFVPPANENFQNALDEIEIDILQAKAVMERDLSRIRKKRAERDRQAGRLPYVSPVKEEQTQRKTEEKPQTNIDGTREDYVAQMTDASHLTDSQPPELIDMNELSNVLGNNSTIGIFENMSQVPQGSQGLALSMPSENNTKSDVTPETAKKPPVGTTDGSVGVSSQPNQATNAPNTDEFDFDSMFNDLDTMPQDASLDLNLDLSTDVGTVSNTFGDGMMGDLNLGSADPAKSLPAPNEDINSLLPGLENFVDAPNDGLVSKTGANIAAAAQSMQQAVATGRTDDTTQAPLDGGLGDSTFDDLFASATFTNAEGDNGDGQDMANEGAFGEFGEFDDDWFKTDGP